MIHIKAVIKARLEATHVFSCTVSSEFSPNLLEHVSTLQILRDPSIKFSGHAQFQLKSLMNVA